MKFALLVRAAPPGPSTALVFAKEALRQGHDIIQVFFQGDGAYSANRLTTPPPSEPSPVADWSRFAADHGIDLVLCSTAGMRRGVREANLAEGFRVSGVGQWLEAALAADRVISFGT